MKSFTRFKRIIVLIILFFLIDFGISELLLGGLNKYFGLYSNSEILLNGSSMFLAGFDKSKIEMGIHKKVAFYSRDGVSLLDRNAMLKHYFNTTNKKTEIAVLEINPLLFSKRFTAANVYMLFLPFMDDDYMCQFVKSKASYKEFFIRKFVRTSRFDVNMILLSLKGYFGIYENVKTQTLDSKVLAGLKNQFNSVPVEFDNDKTALFKSTIKLVQKNSKNIILVNMPIFDSKLKTFKKDEYQVFISFIREFSKNDVNILFLDLNQKQITSNSSFFSDPLHLNVQGQIKASESLNEFIYLNDL